jgi:hypothetical protein
LASQMNKIAFHQIPLMAARLRAGGQTRSMNVAIKTVQRGAGFPSLEQ